jgi:hypothetical protein
MAAVLNSELLQDELALSLARVIAVANRCAREAGVDVMKSLISVFQIADEDAVWRVNYGPKDYVSRRGGDFIVDVDAKDASVKQILHGQ